MIGVGLGVPLSRRRASSGLDLSAAPSLSGLWRPDAGVTLNGSTVAALADQSGLGLHGLQSDPAQQVAWNATGGPNNLPRLTFTGNRHLLVGHAAALKPATLTLYAVTRLNSLNGWQTIWNTSDNASWLNGFGLNKRVATAIYRLGGWVSNYVTNGVDADLTVSTWTILAMRYDGSTVQLWKDGVSQGTFAFAGPIVHASSGPACIGASYSSPGVYAYGANADLIDLALCGAAHSDDTVASIFRGLSARTGIAVAA